MSVTGNRCGHNKNEFRGCDIARRGKGGQPQLIGILSARINMAAHNEGILSTWHRMNKHRSRRSEIREAMEAVLQLLLSEWFQLDSRSCGRRQGDTLRVPDADLIAKQINKTDQWKHRPPMSVWRVRAIIKQFEQCGYFKLSKQRKFQHDTGEWESGPKLITLTKKFFMELGGKHLWENIRQASSERIKSLMLQFIAQGFDNPRRALQRAFKPLFIRTPRQIKHRAPPLPAF